MVPLSISPIKIAYIGYDRSSLLAFEYLGTITPDIDFYIVEAKQDPSFKNFKQYNLLVDHLMIQAKESERTTQHKEVFKKIKFNYNKFQEFLGLKLGPMSEITLSETKSVEPQIRSTSDIIDIKVDDKSKKIFIEIKQKGLEAYDLLIVENHNLIEQEFYARSIKYFKKLSVQANTWVGYEYEVEYNRPLQPSKESKEFWLVSEPENTSLIDNWFLIRLMENKIIVWQWVPTAQLDNPQFEEFMNERTQEIVRKKIHFISIVKIKRQIKTTVTFNEFKKEHMDQNLLSVPNFSFWPKEHINNYLKNRLYKKIRSYEKDQLKKALDENRRQEKEQEKAKDRERSRGMHP